MCFLGRIQKWVCYHRYQICFKVLNQLSIEICCLPAPYKMITQHETVTHCLLFILQPIYLHNLSMLMFSQPIKSCVYQQLLYLLTNQITLQGFWIFNWLTITWLFGFSTSCWNVSRQQQSFSALQSPTWSFSIKVLL